MTDEPVRLLFRTLLDWHYSAAVVCRKHAPSVRALESTVSESTPVVRASSLDVALGQSHNLSVEINY